MREYSSITNQKPVNVSVQGKPKYFRGQSGMGISSFEILNHAKVCKKAGQKEQFMNFYMGVLGTDQKDMLEKAYEKGCI